MKNNLEKIIKPRVLASFGIMPDMRKRVVMEVKVNVNVLRAFILYLVCLIQCQEKKKLSDGELLKILTLNEAGNSGSNIARKIGRSKAAVIFFLEISKITAVRCVQEDRNP